MFLLVLLMLLFRNTHLMCKVDNHLIIVIQYKYRKYQSDMDKERS